MEYQYQYQNSQLISLIMNFLKLHNQSRLIVWTLTLHILVESMSDLGTPSHGLPALLDSSKCQHQYISLLLVSLTDCSPVGYYRGSSLQEHQIFNEHLQCPTDFVEISCSYWPVRYQLLLSVCCFRTELCTELSTH